MVLLVLRIFFGAGFVFTVKLRVNLFTQRLSLSAEE